MGRDWKEACCVASGISRLLGPSYSLALDCNKTSVKARGVKYILVSHRDRSGGGRTNQGGVGHWLEDGLNVQLWAQVEPTRLCDTYTLNSLCWWKDGREGYPAVPGIVLDPVSIW